MKEIKINKDAWHYELIKRYYPAGIEHQCTNICSYVKYLGTSLIILCILSIAIFTLLAGVVDIGALLLVWIQTGNLVPLPLHPFTVVVISILFTILLFVVVYFTLFDARLISSLISPNIANWIDSIKGKTCFKIKFDLENDK